MDGSGITYEGSTCAKSGMPLGGLGTSTLEIGRDGAFRNLRLQNDWCESLNPTPDGTFLSIHLQHPDSDPTGRILQLDAPGDLKAVEGLTYRGRFPFVEVEYRDTLLPCELHMEAFSPFVPGDAASSSLPVVFFTFRLRNPGEVALTASAAISWVNDIAAEKQRSNGWPPSGNRNIITGDREPAVLMESGIPELAGSEYLLSCVPSDGVRYSAVSDWRKGATGRWMGPNVLQDETDPIASWHRFLDDGELPDESSHDDGLDRFSYHRPTGAVAGKVDLSPGEQKEICFALAWYFPIHWDRRTSKAKIDLGHQYAVRFPGGTREIATWAFPKRDVLRDRSNSWRPLIETCSLPSKTRALATEVLYLLPRLSWWLADGTFVLHESVDCPRIQTTVLDIYIAPVLSALFPQLHAKSLRATAARQLASGEIPSTLGFSSVHHCEYRLFNASDASVFPIVVAWQILWGGDPDFAAELYPVLKKILQWGERELDVDRDGIPDVHGVDQGWDTFPMHGAAAYIADQWIAALLAGEKIAEQQGDRTFAKWCRGIRETATRTAENLVWNGSYYDLSHDISTGARSDICFADQFTYGTVPAGILELGETHPADRIRKALDSIWRLNVEPSRFVCRMGSHPDGTPADATIHDDQLGGASQSNAFTPVSVAPLAAAAIQHGMVEEGLELVEEMAGVIIDQAREPWSGQLLFDSNTGNCFYGIHYVDCLILWEVLHALLGLHVNAVDRHLKLAPPRIPVRLPVFGQLFFGMVEFTEFDGGPIDLRMISHSDEVSILQTLSIELPKNLDARAFVEGGDVGGIDSVRSGCRTVLREVTIPAGGALHLRWQPENQG